MCSNWSTEVSEAEARVFASMVSYWALPCDSIDIKWTNILWQNKLQNGDTQLERSYRQNDTTFMDWFVVGIHLLCGKSNNCGKSNKPLQKSHHMYFSSILVTCKWHHQAISISFCTFQSKRICSACGKGANNWYTSAGFTSSSCEDQHGCLSLSIRAARTPS